MAENLPSIADNFYTSLIRPLLFRLPPEKAQAVADFFLQQEIIWKFLSPLMNFHNENLKTQLAGWELANPVGLAAGYDKDCRFLPSLAALGFGYVTGGTVTGSPRRGNPHPRLLRITEQNGLINALGFPNKGLDQIQMRLTSHFPSKKTPKVISVSGNSIDEIVRCHRSIEPLADGIEVNISSPNTSGLKIFHKSETLSALLGQINDKRNKPLFVKLPPFGYSNTGSEKGLGSDRIAELIKVCISAGVEALTVSNTWPVKDKRLSVKTGGISGKPIFQDMLKMVQDVKIEVGNRASINACGGIFTGQDAWEAIQAGATSVQLLTGLIYRGPGIVKQINHELLQSMGYQKDSTH